MNWHPGVCGIQQWREKMIVVPLAQGVKVLYYCAFVDSSSASATPGTIVKANLSSLNLRPASGRAFVCVAVCGGRGLTAFKMNKMHQRLNSIPAIPATLWFGQYEDQPHPGGGSA
jgi:hypothetical protein